MRRYTSLLCLAAILGVTIGLSLFAAPEEADAIPAFARKYRMSCTTCHAPIPRLKAYGDDFAGNGFVLKDKDAPGYFVDTGDDELDLIRNFPFAMRLEGFVQHQTVTDREADLSMPYNVKLLSGGSITKNVAYYFYFYMSEHGEVAGLEDAYLMFNDLFGQDLDIYLGQFQVSDPLFKRELRLTYEDYQIYKSGVAESDVNLAYDRGLMLTYALPSATDFIVEIINGNGLVEADDFKVYDNDKYKNIVGRVSQGIGEYVRVGGFGYYGKEARDEGAGQRTNETWFLGPDATLSYEDKAELNFQYMERRDDNPFFWSNKPEDKVETRGGMTELILMPQGERSKWYFTGLYNWVDSENDADDYETITGHVGYLLRTNIRLIAENTYDIVNEENRFVVGFISAF